MRISRKGFTLLELLIIIGIIAVVATATIILLNPREQIAKANDANRKNQLNELRKIFEDWYNDKGCYPKLDEVCFNTVSAGSCEICTYKPGSPSLKEYSNADYCDPEEKTKHFLYQILASQASCPKQFYINSKLSTTYSRQNDILNCGPAHSCGPAPLYGYDYYVSSPNTGPNASLNNYCFNRWSDCGSCGTIDSCQSAIDNNVCITIYTSDTACCLAHPSANSCS